jgi:hypothetical protein
MLSRGKSMKNLKIAGILIGLALVNHIAYSMEIEESAEEKLAKKQKIEVSFEDFLVDIRNGNLEKINKTLDILSPDEQKKLVNYANKFGNWPLKMAWWGNCGPQIPKSYQTYLL